MVFPTRVQTVGLQVCMGGGLPQVFSGSTAYWIFAIRKKYKRIPSTRKFKIFKGNFNQMCPTTYINLINAIDVMVSDIDSDL